jgi:DNA-binding response OmpR family regulator
MVAPSCPALLLHDDDAFRKTLIAALDANHFTVTYFDSGAAAVEALQQRAFRVILLSLDLAHRKGIEVLDYLGANARGKDAALIIIGEPHAELRNHSRLADETLIKPVDASYVVSRARTYCA